jgi:hypothetical protein
MGAVTERLCALARAGDAEGINAVAMHDWTTDVNVAGDDGLVPLHWAVLAHSEDAVHALLSAGAAPNGPVCPADPASPTAFEAAALVGTVATLHQLSCWGGHAEPGLPAHMIAAFGASSARYEDEVWRLALVLGHATMDTAAACAAARECVVAAARCGRYDLAAVAARCLAERARGVHSCCWRKPMREARFAVTHEVRDLVARRRARAERALAAARAHLHLPQSCAASAAGPP